MLEQKKDKWRIRTLGGKLRYKKVFGAFWGESGEKPPQELQKEDIVEGRGLAILAYIPFLCFIPFLNKKNNRFAYEHGKQGVALFIIELLMFITIIFWKSALFILSIVALVGIFYAIRGKIWRIPFISDIADKFDIED